MLKPHEIFARMSSDAAAQVFTHLFENEKPLYKATIESLAKQRKLRPIFVERKPRTERYAWLQETLARKTGEGIAAHILQIWLVGAHSKLLCDFLDALGIAHDENGTIEALPPAPPTEKLVEAIEILRKTHDPAVINVYLHAFQALDDHGWTTLEELLATDESLQLKPAVASAEPSGG